MQVSSSSDRIRYGGMREPRKTEKTLNMKKSGNPRGRRSRPGELDINPIGNTISSKRSMEDARGKGCDCFRRPGEEVRHREGLAVCALGPRRGSGHHRRALRAGSEHGGAEALVAARRARGLHQPRGVTDIE